MIGNRDEAQYDFNLLQRINSITISGVSIADYFQQDEYSLWSFQQFYILLQIRKFSSCPSLIGYLQVAKKGTFFWKRIPAVSLLLLISCIALIKLLLTRPSVIVFCPDILKPGSKRDVRLYNVYEAFEKAHISFFEIVHVHDLRKAVANMFRRRRMVLYFEAINIISFLFKKKRDIQETSKLLDSLDLSSFDDEEKQFVQVLLRQVFENIRMSRFKIIFFSWLFKHGGAKHFVSIDDVRYTNEIIIACQKTHIQSCQFQHSNFDYLKGVDTLPPAYYVFPDIFFLWNTYWQKRILELSPLYAHYGDRLAVGGRAYAYTQPHCIKHDVNTKDSEVITVVIPYEVNVTAHQIRSYIDALIATKRVHIMFLPRTDFDIPSQIKKYFDATDVTGIEAVTLITGVQKHEIFERADVVLGVYSGFLDEAIEFCMPVGVFETDYPTFNRLQDEGMAAVLRLSDGDVYEQLCKIKATPASTLSERRERLVAGTGDSGKAIIDFLKN